MRRPQAVVRAIALLGALAAGWSSVGAAQDLALAGRTPRFFYARTVDATPKEIDVARFAVLRQIVSLRVEAPTIGRLLRAVEQQTRLTFAYDNDFPVQRPITLRADSITVAAALSAILLDTGVDVLLTPGGNAALVKTRSRSLSVGAGSIVGRVTDAKNGQGIVDAEVLLSGTRWHAATDTTGHYRLAGIEAGRYTLVARRIGYAKADTVIVVAEHDDTVNIALEPRATHLDELVTTATGRRRRAEVPNDISLLDVDSIMRTQPAKSVTDILEGRVPGLFVQHTSGAPGDPSRLRLRGASSPLLNNDPIVVVDGVRIYAEQSATRSANLATLTSSSAARYATPSPLDYIDPNSIETIEVVKGASAATLYGQDAANGVIIITTKKGKAGPTRWTMSAEHGVTEMVAQYPERFLRWGHTVNANVLVSCPVGNLYSPPAGACVGDSIVRFQLLNEPDLTPFGKGYATTAALGVSGGVRSLTYSVNGNYRDEIGLLRLPDYEIANYKARVGQTPPDWMQRPQALKQWEVTGQLRADLGPKADLTMSTMVGQTDQQRSALENQLGDLDATYLDRASGTYYQAVGTRQTGFPGIGCAGRSVCSRSVGLNDYYTKVTSAAAQLTTGLALNWRPWSWMTTAAQAGINVIHRADEAFLLRNASATDSTGRLSDGQGRSITRTMSVRANAVHPLGRGFTLQGAVGADYTSVSTLDLAAATTDIPAGQEVPGNTFERPIRLASDRATFGWYVDPSVGNSRFNLDIGLRLDGGSSYGAGLKLPTFPKLGGSWLISDEPFFPFKDVFSSFRLRASYGRASRQPGPADRLRLYSSTTQQFVDGQSVPTTVLQTLGNTQLRPERTGELEGGFDADLVDSRFHVEVTGYRKTTDDALLPTPLPPSIGIGSILRNIGVTRNTGLDVTVGAQLVRSAPVTWTTNLILSHRRDEVVRLGPGVQPFTLNSLGGLGAEDQRIVPGYPLAGFWAKPIIGYSDVNGDGLISPGEVVVGDTMVYRGSPLPDYTATVSSSVSLWRGAVQLTADLLYDKGMTQHPTTSLIQRQVGLSAGRNDPSSSIAEQVVYASTAAGSSYAWYQQVSTTRLNAVSVSYNAPAAMARRVGAERLTISLQGSNLRLWSNYRGVDPNVNGAVTGEVLVDNGTLPRPRLWQVRVNAAY